MNIPTKAQTNVQEILSDIDFSSDDIMKILSNLKADKSPGPDKIHPSVLKECADVLAYPLYLLFRKSLNEGSLPQDWKDGNVTPIFKKGLKCQVDNYRPVSLTSVICKVMEKVVRNALLNHLMENSLLADNQHGFVPGRSCVNQLLEVLDKWTEILDNGSILDAVYLDFSKAFDSVPHKRLLIKLQSYGVEGKVLQWIQSFLSDRRQKVYVSGAGSSWSYVTSGVPQGSVLGPVLFVCYINDMPEVVKSMIYLYADDAKIGRQIVNDSDKDVLQLDLDELEKWAKKWQMKFNPNKCKVMHIGNKDSTETPYSVGQGISSEKLSITNEEKYLGVWFDTGLKFSSHISCPAIWFHCTINLKSSGFDDCTSGFSGYGGVCWCSCCPATLLFFHGISHGRSGK